MHCIHPTLISKGKLNYYVPCGRCAWCRRRKQDDWFFRLTYESRCWPYVFFVTFTYDEEHIPTEAVDSDGVVRSFRGYTEISEDDLQVRQVPIKEDFQKYMKRLTKRISLLPYHERFYQKPSGQFYLKPSDPGRRYFAVPELGHESSRPHFHMILFSTCDVDCSLDWPFGGVVQGPADLGSFRYITKYCLKGASLEFNRSLSSRGLGEGYSNFLSQVEKFDQEEKFYLPRYLRDKWTSLIDSRFLQNDIALGLVPPDAKHCLSVQSFKDSIFDELYFSDPHSKEYKSYLESGVDMTFEDYLSELYMLDFRKQIKINGSGKV